MPNPENEASRRWAAKIDELDGFVFVTPEYNHSIPGPLKIAIDALMPQWNNKAAALVGYGGVGAARAIEHLRGILSELQIAHVRQTLTLSLITDFIDFSRFAPGDHNPEYAATMFDQLEAWAHALASVREQGTQAT